MLLFLGIVTIILAKVEEFPQKGEINIGFNPLGQEWILYGIRGLVGLKSTKITIKVSL